MPRRSVSDPYPPLIKCCCGHTVSYVADAIRFQLAHDHGAGYFPALFITLIYDRESICAMEKAPLPPPGTKAAEVRRMFGAIAGHYDLLNHLLSMNRDKAWRRLAVDALLQGRLREPPVPGRLAGSTTPVVLDSCAGTFDLSIELARRPEFQGAVLGFDFTLPMLERGLPKIRRGLSVMPACADALRLPLADNAVDGAMVGFGIRNVADLDACLLEFARVIRPGGRLVILEFSTPQWQPFRALYLTYFRQVLPRIGRLISKEGVAYSYLPASVLAFPEPEALRERIEAAGFTQASWRALTGGIVALHSATRAE
jgi:demethylmenaquinone methyltransferase/2-methoxy-6-polyprenyl-1,4-benzoquinol methylase